MLGIILFLAAAFYILFIRRDQFDDYADQLRRCRDEGEHHRNEP